MIVFSEIVFSPSVKTSPVDIYHLLCPAQYEIFFLNVASITHNLNRIAIEIIVDSWSVDVERKRALTSVDKIAVTLPTQMVLILKSTELSMQRLD